MTNQSFGLDRVGTFGQLDALLRDLPAVRPTTAERLSRIAYQTDYGIYNHARPDAHPLASVMMHPMENVYEGGPELTYIRRWHAHNFHGVFGLSLNDYFATPFHVTEFLYEMIQSINQNPSLMQRQAAEDIRKMNI